MPVCGDGNRPINIGTQYFSAYLPQERQGVSRGMTITIACAYANHGNLWRQGSGKTLILICRPVMRDFIKDICMA